MSVGHSKWSSIKHKRAPPTPSAASSFKLSRAIIVAAKEGEVIPPATVIQNAVEGEVLLDAQGDIDRAIAKGSGADADASAFEGRVRGVRGRRRRRAHRALTDNRNRTAADVRHVFAKHNGNLGTTGAVAWIFERRGIVLVDAGGVDEDELLLAAADGGADDVEPDGSVFQVSCAIESLASVRAAVEAAGFHVESAELSMVPKTTVTIEDEATARKVVHLIEALEDLDDVQDVYANFDIPEHVLEAVAS